MNSSQLVSTLFLVAVINTPAWAVYKCQDASGRISYQQAPCNGASPGEKLDVGPASGNSAKAQAPATPPGGAQPPATTETDRLNLLSGRLAKENRLSTLNNLHIPGAHSEIQRARTRCESEIDAVRKRKALATKDLAGATWEQSLSSEMQAIAAQCDTEQRRLQAHLDQYLAEKQELQSELAKP